MLPNSLSTPSSSSIHINPRFRNVHINPSFLSKTNTINGKPTESPVTVTAPTQIYINPRFLASPSIQGITQTTNSTPIQCAEQISQYHVTAQVFHETNKLVAEPLADTKIHTRTKIIKPSVVRKKVPDSLIEKTQIQNATKSLIKIGSKKLVRVPAKPFTKLTEKTVTKVRRPLQTKYKIIKEQTAFKIDRRSNKAKLASITPKITSIHISPTKKVSLAGLLAPTKMVKGYELQLKFIKKKKTNKTKIKLN